MADWIGYDLNQIVGLVIDFEFEAKIKSNASNTCNDYVLKLLDFHVKITVKQQKITPARCLAHVVIK